MEINVAELKNDVGATETFAVDELLSDGRLFGDGVKAVEPITGTVTATNTGDGIRIKGEIATALSVKCSRCLGYFTLPLTVEVAGEYRELAGEATETGQSSDESGVQEDPDVVYFQGDSIDLTGLFEESLLLAFPIKPVCREDCRGICPICGQDLNETVCNCKEERIDPRLAVLKQLLEE